MQQIIENNDDRIYRHQIPAQLRFSDVDQFGHVNNNVYFSLFDMCKTRYFLDVLGRDIFKRLGIVLAHTEADFISPIYFPDEIAIETMTEHIGNKSITLRQRAINTRTHEVKCECKSIMVCFDLKTSQGVSVPDFCRNAINDFEELEQPLSGGTTSQTPVLTAELQR